MTQYTFPTIKNATFSEGYITIEVKNGLAEIDEADAGQMAIAKKYKATKFIAPKKTQKTKVFKAGK